MNKEQTTIEVDAKLWWDGLEFETKRSLAVQYFGVSSPDSLNYKGWELIYKSEHPTAPTVEKNNEAYTKGEWELSFARWAPEGLPVGFNIKSGGKQIVTFNVTNESHVISPEAIKNFPDLLEQHLSQEEMEANAELIASAPRLKQENKKLLEDNKLLREALQGIINDWTERMHGEIEVHKETTVGGDGRKYWSPSSATVSSQFIAAARKALEQTK